MGATSLEERLLKHLDRPIIRIISPLLSILSSSLALSTHALNLLNNPYKVLLVIISAIFITISILSYLSPRIFVHRIPIYESRTKFLQHYFKKFIDESKYSVVIINIIFTWFSEIEGDLLKKLKDNDNFRFEVLLLKRIREPGERSYLLLREQDEGVPLEHLVKQSNLGLYLMFKFLVKLSKEDININSVQVKEYGFMPSVCAYIFDERKLVFGPYISKNCDRIPMFEIEQDTKNADSDISLSFEEIIKHSKILKGKTSKHLKEKFVERFSYWDGQDRSIHDFIGNRDATIIEDILNANDDKYKTYLQGKIYTELDDDIIQAFEDNCPLEVRFDAVIRDIDRKYNAHYNTHYNAHTQRATQLSHQYPSDSSQIATH